MECAWARSAVVFDLGELRFELFQILGSRRRCDGWNKQAPTRRACTARDRMNTPRKTRSSRNGNGFSHLDQAKVYVCCSRGIQRSVIDSSYARRCLSSCLYEYEEGVAYVSCTSWLTCCTISAASSAASHSDVQEGHLPLFQPMMKMR